MYYKVDTSLGEAKYALNGDNTTRLQLRMANLYFLYLVKIWQIVGLGRNVGSRRDKKNWLVPAQALRVYLIFFPMNLKVSRSQYWTLIPISIQSLFQCFSGQSILGSRRDKYSEYRGYMEIDVYYFEVEVYHLEHESNRVLQQK